jgi:flagellar hook protein FlgE
MGVRSLFAGVSGLRNFQLQLDIIGNNIANSQTAGYKSSRVTFADLLSQTTQGATAPSSTVGGTNPQQYGLGSQIGAIDMDLTQGNLLNTGRQLDIAISGNGFFKVSDGNDLYYTRNGAFDIDEAGNLVSTTSGYVVQGYNATAGVLDMSAVDDIVIPVGIVLPAQETTTVDLVGNLDSTAEQIASIYDSESLLATDIAGASDIEGIFGYGNLNSRITGMQPTVTDIDVAYDDGAGGSGTLTLTYVSNDSTTSDGNFTTLADLVQELNAGLSAASNYSAALIAADGDIRVTNGGGSAGSITVSSSNSALQSALSGLTGAYAAGATRDSDEFAHTATDADYLVNLRDSTGTDLGVTSGETINIDGSVGGTAVTTGTLPVTATTSISQLASSIATAYGIDTNGTIGINAGRLRIEGDGGSNYALSDIALTTATGGLTFDDTFDSTTGNWSQVQTAQDNHTTSFIAYDSDGVRHTVSIHFNNRDAVGGLIQTVYDIESVETSSGTSESVGNGTGLIQFNPDGSLYDFSPSQFTISPTSTANLMQITIDPGTVNAYDGLVAFENDSSARFAELTGYASGELQDISINAAGTIVGNFTNGQNQTLSQLVLSMFDNPEGLEKVGGNYFSPTLNSGAANDSEPGTAGRGSLITAALEGSNVDLAKEFVTLITAQRGFQSNARIITAANDVLGELVNLVR